MNTAYLNTKVGCLKITEQDGFITNIDFVRESKESAESPVLSKAVQQLEAYFNGTAKNFDLPLCPKGTEFQKKVWQALQQIPYGETRCYQDIAAAIGNENASRAVGMANNKNPIPIIIPCHRVIGKNGKLVGYAGGIDIKEELLELERKTIMED